LCPLLHSKSILFICETVLFIIYKRLWIAGTAEYTQGLVEHVTVLVGVAIDRTAVGGVIHQPYYKNDESDTYIEDGRTLWGINGAGYGGFMPKLPPDGKRIITTTRSHSDGIVQTAIKSLNPDEVARVGGAGHKVIADAITCDC